MRYVRVNLVWGVPTMRVERTGVALRLAGRSESNPHHHCRGIARRHDVQRCSESGIFVEKPSDADG